MDSIQIYSSRKKSFLLLIGSTLFVIMGILMVMKAGDDSASRVQSPAFIKAMGIASILFFGLGIYVSIRQVIKDHLVLIVNENGLHINPNKFSSEQIAWNEIRGFSEIKIRSTKLVIIDLYNSEYWIEKEQNKIRKQLMKFNFNNYGSPFSLSAQFMQIDHEALMKILTENLNWHRSNVSG